MVNESNQSKKKQVNLPKENFISMNEMREKKIAMIHILLGIFWCVQLVEILKNENGIIDKQSGLLALITSCASSFGSFYAKVWKDKID